MFKFNKPLLIFLIFFFVAHIAAASEEELVFAISPMASPVSTVSNYNNFIKYLSEKTGTKIILKP